MIYSNLAVLGNRYGFGAGLAAFELKVFSQNGEDGVIAEIFNRIGTESKFFVEFGIGPGIEGNSVLLADVHNWRGLFIESSDAHFSRLQYKYEGFAGVATRHESVTAENIEAILGDAGVPSDFDILSIDIDGNDYWIWQAITNYRPRVVVCEYNGNIDPTTSFTQPYMPASGWDGTEYFGASLRALSDLGQHKGYVLVHTDLTGTNACFVVEEHAEAFVDCLPVAARRSLPVFTDTRPRPDDRNRAYLSPEPAIPPLRFGNGQAQNGEARP